jgi:hypothetical protein
MVGQGADFAKTWALKGASALKGIATTAGGAISGALKAAWKMPADITKWGLKGLMGLKGIATTGATAIATALKGAMPGMTGIATTAAGAGGKGLKTAAKVGKLLLKGAKFIPGAGLIITGAVALYDGLTAGMEEFKKSGDLGKAIKEGTAGALSGITFGLISQKPFQTSLPLLAISLPTRLRHQKSKKGL